MFSLDKRTGILREARQVSSPNCDERPSQCPPDLFVVHGISLPPGEFGGPWIDRLFTNCLLPDVHPYFREIEGLRVSAHFLIRRDGELVQYVPVTHRAWHAGQSCYGGREACNDFSIGVELEGENDVPYELAQYDCLAKLITFLRQEIPSLAHADVVGHSDIAPGRKSDPGRAFEWPRLLSMLAEDRGTKV